MTPFLAGDIAQDEGLRLEAYTDTLGIWTVGYGHAHVAPKTVWTHEQANVALRADIDQTIGLLDKNIPWWRNLNDARQDVMVNLCFNMGWGDGKRGLSSFKNTLAAIDAGNFTKAADGLLASKWATQVHGRATRLATQMRTGVRADPFSTRKT